MVYNDFKIPGAYKVLLGAFCGMVASTVVHPIDLLKARMQIFPEAISTVNMAIRITRCEGPRALYNGLSAGLMRQATYTTTRLGVYYWMYEEHKHVYGKVPTLPDRMMIGTCAGLVGAFAGNPSEVALIRMMADGRKDPCESLAGRTRRYRGVFDAFYKIITNEGICALWRGSTLTLARSVLVSLAHIGTDKPIRVALKKLTLDEGPRLHIYTAVTSSFITACLTLPVDLVKSRYQYKSEKMKVTQIEILQDILRTKGVTYLWHGFFPYFIRLSLHTILTFILMNELSQRYIKHYQPTKT